jgi:dephospho-CoA kinase
VQAAQSDLVIVDGIRRVSDLKNLEQLTNFTLVSVTAPPEERFARMKLRGEKSGENNMTYEQFTAEENAPTELSIPEVAARASRSIDNAGTDEALRQQVDALATSLGLVAKT